jgi:hypothetical protein
MGQQSAGKSSLLENIVGLDFLPRGEGICTRRPLELRMVHTTGPMKPYAVFQGVEEKFTDFLKVREKINDLTDKDAGQKKGSFKVNLISQRHYKGGYQIDDLLTRLPGFDDHRFARDYESAFERI